MLCLSGFELCYRWVPPVWFADLVCACLRTFRIEARVSKSHTGFVSCLKYESTEGWSESRPIMSRYSGLS